MVTRIAGRGHCCHHTLPVGGPACLRARHRTCARASNVRAPMYETRQLRSKVGGSEHASSCSGCPTISHPTTLLLVPSPVTWWCILHGSARHSSMLKCFITSSSLLTLRCCVHLAMCCTLPRAGQPAVLQLCAQRSRRVHYSCISCSGFHMPAHLCAQCWQAHRRPTAPSRSPCCRQH